VFERVLFVAFLVGEELLGFQGSDASRAWCYLG
jgi:hypothetical protein